MTNNLREFSYSFSVSKFLLSPSATDGVSTILTFFPLLIFERVMKNRELISKDFSPEHTGKA
jgi:hypothetical protein